MGRGKIEIKKIENRTRQQVTFCKRKNGLLKKAYELSQLCDAEVGLIIFSNRGILHEFASKSIRETVERYNKIHRENMQQGEALIEFDKARKLRQQCDILTNSIRQLMGETPNSLGMKQLRQIEVQMEKSISRIRSRKNEVMLEEIKNLQRQEFILMAENQLLRSKIQGCEGSSNGRDQLEVPVPHLYMQNSFVENIVMEIDQSTQPTSVLIQTALQLG